jgi:hypothetical protein
MAFLENAITKPLNQKASCERCGDHEERPQDLR